VVEAILELDRTDFKGALAIADADYTVLDRQPSPSPNLLVTDHHDVETMLIASPALEHVLRELGKEESIVQFERERGIAVRAHLAALARPIGYLRWLSSRNAWSLRFEALQFERFVRDKTLVLDELALLETLRNPAGHAIPESKQVQAALSALIEPAHDVWHVCCGHDLVVLLSLGLRKLWGSNADAEVKPERLERELRLAYESAYFLATNLYAAIRVWESRNAPFRVLPSPL
jgi:hypothetical protein